MIRFTRGKYRLTLALVVLATLLALIPYPAYACSCPPPDTLAGALEQADAIFSGKALDLQPIIYSEYGVTLDRATLAVSQVWKGPVAPILVVEGGICGGYGFEIGKEYLVYASQVDEEELEMHDEIFSQFDIEEGLIPLRLDLEVGDLVTSYCTGTQPLADATEELAVLGKSTIVAAENAEPPASSFYQFRGVDGKPFPLACTSPLALIGILGFFPMRARLKSRTRNR